jgi:hypothetical protein
LDPGLTVKVLGVKVNPFWATAIVWRDEELDAVVEACVDDVVVVGDVSPYCPRTIGRKEMKASFPNILPREKLLRGVKLN